MARKVILNDSLMVDSHPVGYKWMMNEVQGRNVKVIDQYISDEYRDQIRIVNNAKKDDE